MSHQHLHLSKHEARLLLYTAIIVIIQVSLTIMLEAGVQNIAFATLIIQESIPAPDNGLALALPILFFLITFIPLLALVIGRALHDIVKNRSHQAILVTLHPQGSRANLELKGLPVSLQANPFSAANNMSATANYDIVESISCKSDVKVPTKW